MDTSKSSRQGRFHDLIAVLGRTEECYRDFEGFAQLSVEQVTDIESVARTAAYGEAPELYETLRDMMLNIQMEGLDQSGVAYTHDELFPLAEGLSYALTVRYWLKVSDEDIAAYKAKVDEQPKPPPAEYEIDDDGRNVSRPHDCLAEGKICDGAYYGAPGIGRASQCNVCGRHWAKIGGQYHDPSEGAHILSPEQCR